MPKTNIPNYRHHKASGQAFVELGGRRFYLGKHGSKASREEYERRIAEYLGNGRQLAPTQTKTGISCQELAVRFLEWAEGYYVKNGKQTTSFGHCRTAISLFVEHYHDWHWEQEIRIAERLYGGSNNAVQCYWCEELIDDAVSDCCPFCYSDLTALCVLCDDEKPLSDCIIFDDDVYCRNCLERPSRASRRFRF